MGADLTSDFDTAMREHIWLDGMALNQLSEEQYKEYIEQTFMLDHHEQLRLYRGAEKDLAPGSSVIFFL